MRGIDLLLNATSKRPKPKLKYTWRLFSVGSRPVFALLNFFNGKIVSSSLIFENKQSVFAKHNICLNIHFVFSVLGKANLLID